MEVNILEHQFRSRSEKRSLKSLFCMSAHIHPLSNIKIDEKYVWKKWKAINCDLQSRCVIYKQLKMKRGNVSQ